MNKKPKILIVIGNLEVGGAEQHLLRVMPRLNKLDFEVMIYTTNHLGVLAPKMQTAGVNVIAPPFSKALKRLGKLGKPIVYALSVITLSRLIKKSRPTIIHYFLPGAYLLGSVAAMLSGCVCSVMSRRIIYNDEYRRHLFFKLEKRLHKRLTFALACSKDIKKELIQEGIPLKKIDIIYNGIDTGLYKNLLNQQAARKQLNLPTQAFVMVIVANLYLRKGHIDLLNALAQIKHQLPKDWVLLVVGRDGGERATLEKYSEKLLLTKHIKWMGQCLDVRPILAASNIGILCSHEEGFSNALLECMASGLPMVATDVSGSNEAIIHNDNGLIVPIARPELLAAAILQLASDAKIRKQMSENTVNRVEKYFSLDKVIDQYRAFYLSLLSSRLDRLILDHQANKVDINE